MELMGCLTRGEVIEKTKEKEWRKGKKNVSADVIVELASGEQSEKTRV